MPYTKYNDPWANGSGGATPIVAAALDHIEAGIAAAIPAPASPSTSDGLFWNGSAWVADTINNAKIAADAAIAYSKLNLSASIVNADIASAAAIAQSKLAFDAWAAFTPTWTADSANPSIGDGILAGRYVRIGDTVIGQVLLTAGSTTTFGTGNWSFSLPLTAANGTFRGLGMASITDASPFAIYSAMVRINGATVVQLATTASPTVSVDATVPMTWASGDSLGFQFTYEAA